MESKPGTGSRLAEPPDLSMPCRLMFDGSPLPTIAVVGARHIVCYVNPAFCGLSAKSDDELIGNPFAEIVIEEGFLSILERVYRRDTLFYFGNSGILRSAMTTRREEKFEQNFRSEVCRKYAIRFAPLCSKSSLFSPNQKCFRAGFG